MPRRLSAMFTAFVLAAALAAPASARFSDVIVFGDSLSDPGNAAALSGSAFPPAAFYPFGTFSNGPTAAQYLAASFGATTVGGWPVADGANNFAVGGARVGDGNFNVQADSPPGLGVAFPALTATGIGKQIARYDAGSLTDPARTLFVLWGAPNDFFLGFHVQGALGVPVDFAALAQQTVTTLAGHVVTLASLGAKHILVPNMPDLGLTPFATAQGPAFAALASALTDGFNAGLAGALGAAQGALAPWGVKLYGFDSAGFVRAAVADPAAYGFSNVTTRCLYDAAAPSCDGYLFYDDVHPTTFAHAQLAQAWRVAVIPEPATWAFMLAGLVAVAGAARRGAARG